MKRIILFLLVICMTLTMLPATAIVAKSTSVTATPINPIVYINGKKVSFEAYTIKGDNYFKIRDLAMAFNSTNKKFDFGSDSTNKTVEITANKEYVPVGGELTLGDGKKKSAKPVKLTVHWLNKSTDNGLEQLNCNIKLNAYTIDGNNFVNLRDLMQWVNVGVGYDSKTSSIVIDTYQQYVLPKYIGNPLKAAEKIAKKYRSDYGAEPGSIQNEGVIVYQDDWYYTPGYKVKEGGKAVGYKSDYGDVIAYNWQVYGNKIFFEGDQSTSVTTQTVYSMNLDGSGLKKIITNSRETGRSITIYKGMLYANTCATNSGQNTSILRYNLDGTGRKVLYTGNLSTLPRSLSYGHRAYSIFNDRIYYMTQDKTVYSMKLDGSNQKKITTLSKSSLYIVNVYDGYIYYDTREEGLHRVKIDGTGDMCVLPEGADQYAIYGDKIIYNIGTTMVGVVNCDGTSRYQFPNAKQDPEETTECFWSNITLLNSKYTYTQNVIFNNSSTVPGHIRLVAGYSEEDSDIRGKRGWFPTKKPYINTLSDIIPINGTKASGKTLTDGIYFIKCAKDTQYGMDVRDASIENGANILVNRANGSTSQKFRITKVDDNKYTIKNINSGRWWSSTGIKGQKISQSGPTNNANTQTFTIAKQTNGHYRIIDSNGFHVGASAGNVAVGSVAELWTGESDPGQEYIFEKLYVKPSTDIIHTHAEDSSTGTSDTKASADTLTNGTYYIKAVKDTKYGVDVPNSSKLDGTGLILYTMGGTNNQKFTLTNVGDNKYTINNINSNKNWTSNGKKGSSITQSTPVSGNSAQIFTLEIQADGTYRIKDSTGFYVGISSGKVSDYTKIILWTEASDGSQTYLLENID